MKNKINAEKVRGRPGKNNSVHRLPSIAIQPFNCPGGGIQVSVGRLAVFKY